ncbi:glycine/D-amino acid oxidase-like deaminating enzyme [Mesorhizobium sp. USDA 4775]
MNGGPEIVDLFVIGGGVNGAGIARDAAGRGLSVILCEKDDLAEGTSSRSRQARPWRPALPRILRVPPGARGADRA